MTDDAREEVPEGVGGIAPEERFAVPQPTGTSGWEKADRVAGGIGKAAEVVGNVGVGIATVLTKIWGLIIIALGVAAFVFVPQYWWSGLLLIAYGIYLLFPGDKWVIW